MVFAFLLSEKFLVSKHIIIKVDCQVDWEEKKLPEIFFGISLTSNQLFTSPKYFFSYFWLRPQFYHLCLGLRFFLNILLNEW